MKLRPEQQDLHFSKAKGPARPPELRTFAKGKIIVDLFAGGGGFSLAVEMALGRSPDIAVNHDPEALAMHKANHRQTEHYQEDIYDVDPVAVCKGQPVGLLVMSPDCFPAGTLVLTRDGYQPIEQVTVGDEVLTHLGRWRPVTSVMSSVKTVDKIRGYGHPGLLVSSEHPFYTRVTKHGEPEWRRARDLDRGMYWATPIAFPEMPIPPVPLGKNRREMTLNTDLMWLAGRYVADGWTRLTDTRAELVLTCGHHKTEALRTKLSVWTRADARAVSDELAWHERDTTTAHQFTTDHRGLVTWLRDQFGHRAEGKFLPTWLLGASVEMREAFLAGYLAGDGYLQHRRGSGHSVYRCSTVSKALAYGLKALASSLGKSVGVHPGHPSNEIEGRIVNALPSLEVKWAIELADGHRQTVRDGHLEWAPIRARLDGVEDDVEVFNISVADDESYVVEGIVVHNCTDHSKAKNGAIVRNKKVRSLARVAIDWARLVRPDVIILENVEEWWDWGPLDEHGRPDKTRRGEYRMLWWERLEALGYKLSMRIMKACDYGAPTSRKRLVVIARCDGIDPESSWPVPTHGPGTGEPYRTAAECIDYSIPCPSIFMTKRQARKFTKATGIRCKRPLADKTMRRIRRGLYKYVLRCQKPFTIRLTGDDDRVYDPDEPVRTVTAAPRGEFAVVSPIVTPVKTWGGGGNEAAPANRPLRTVTTSKRGEYAVVTPVLQSYYGDPVNRNQVRTTGLDQPVPTQTTANRFALVAPTLVQTGYGERPGQKPRCLDLQEPLGTVISGGDGCGNGKHALVQSRLEKCAAWIYKGFGDDSPKRRGGFPGGASIDRPLGTITRKDHHQLAVSHMVKLRGTSDSHMESSSMPADAPIPTVSAGGNHIAEVRAFLEEYEASVIDDGGEPSAKERAGILTIDGTDYQIVDIGMRMLEPRELYRAMGFPDSYIIDPVVTTTRTTKSGRVITKTAPLNKTQQVEKCGNAVSPPLFSAVISAVAVAQRALAAA